MSVRLTLSEALQKAARGTLPSGWLYLASAATPTPESECLLLLDQETCEDAGEGSDVPPAAVAAGFPVEGLDTATLEDTALCAKRFEKSPSNALLVESFFYYWRFDAFLPFPGAPDPPPTEVIRLQVQRSFYDSLGEERSSVPCKHEGCHRGAVPLSVFCRAHHFEQVRQEACPFSD